MEYRRLGRTGMQVSLLGQGCGGPSQLGQHTNVDQAGIDRLIALGLDAGINFFDTAEAYGDSETILGRALSGIKRDHYYLASKFTVIPFNMPEFHFSNGFHFFRNLEK